MASRGEFLIFLIICTFLLFPSPTLDVADSEKKLLDIYNQERELMRSTLFNSTYLSGYGNITGFKLSYLDAVKGRNISLYPFPDKDYSHFHEDEEYSILPNKVSQLALDIWNGANNNNDNRPYITNLTASFKGSFVRSPTNFTCISMPLPRYLKPYLDDLPFDYNDDNDNDSLSHYLNSNEDFKKASASDSTGFAEDESAGYHYNDQYAAPLLDATDKVGNVSGIDNGKLVMEIKALKNEENQTNVDFIPSVTTLKLMDFNEHDYHSISISGIYFSKVGNFFGTTKSAKFQSIYALPHLLLNEGNYNIIKEYMYNKSLYYESLEVSRNLSFTSMKEEARQSAKCEYLTYFHISPVNLTRLQLNMIEDEIDNPLGRPIAKVPELVIDKGLLFSPDCGILLEFLNVSGTSRSVHVRRIRKSILAAILLIFAQLYLLIRQMNVTNTPPTISRISYYTLSLMNLVDGTSTMLLLLTTVIIFDLYIPLAIASLLAFTLSSIFELRYMISVYISQVNEQSMDFWTALRGNASSNTNETTNTESSSNNVDGGLPTAQVPQAFQPPAQLTPAVTDDERTISSSLYSRYFFSIIFFSFIILNLTTWSRPARKVAEKVILVFISSFWYPQIFRNVVRGSNTCFTWEFMIGTSIVRLIPAFYIYGYPNNVFYHHTSPKFLTFLVLWIVASLMVLGIQEKYGPRILIPKKYLPKIYNYHPMLSLDDLENSFGIDLINDERKVTGTSDPHKHVYRVECAICMNSLAISVTTHQGTEADDNEASEHGSLLGKQVAVADTYMVTPCRHVFHNDCLESWMRYKLQCPVCRNSLPPV